MSSQSTVMEDTSLGEFLREARNKQGLDLTAISEETKISLKNLQAIEEDDFKTLPAEAFTRGFYTLYAKSLLLDPADVLKRYAEKKPNKTKPGNRTNPPGRLAMDVSNMAERPTLIPFSMFGLILLLLLLFGAFLCWYFSWNPATFLSQKLRSLQEESPQIEQVLESQSAPDVPPNLFEVSRTGINKPRNSFQFNLPSTATASTSPQARSETISKHQVEFDNPPKQQLSEWQTEFIWPKHNQPQAALSLEIGQSSTWSPENKLTITFPANHHSRSISHRYPLDLSSDNYTFVTLTIPSYNLQY